MSKRKRMVDSSQSINEFADFFGMESGLADLDFGGEILAQLTGPDWRSAHQPCDAGLYLGCPLTNEKRELSVDTLFWCPFGWPSGKLKAIVSSRAGKKLTEEAAYARALRNFLLFLSTDDVVITASGSTLDLAVQRGTQLFSIHAIRLVPFPAKIDAGWITKTLQPSRDAPAIYYRGPHRTPDDLMFAMSDEVRVIDARPGGNIMRLIEKYRDPHSGPVVMSLVRPPDSKDRRKTGQYAHPGSVAWYLFDETETISAVPRDSSPIRKDKMVQLDDIEGDYLSHWTRSDRRPWPDQTRFNQFDHLFLGSTAESGPLRSLCRILVQQKLLASGQLIRGGDRVVCFTEVPLCDFSFRRIFRSQLARWDFELFGISIRCDAAKRLGARPVQYVSREAFLKNRKPGHPSHTVLTSGPSSVDWSREREWRIVGDVSLRALGPDEAVVFVPDSSSADVIRQFSRWPVVVLDSSSVSARSPGNDLDRPVNSQLRRTSRSAGPRRELSSAPDIETESGPGEQEISDPGN